MSNQDSATLSHSNTEGKHLGLALAVISGAQLMIVLDATVVNVALPAIYRGLHFTLANLQWLVTAYSLTFGGLLLLGGRMGDLYGRRRMFMVGIIVFSLASLLGGFAHDQLWLIVTRGLQGVGGAIASPTALSLIATNFAEGRERNRAMGTYAAMSGAGGAVGLLLGGVLVSYVSWRWVFFVNVPIGALILFATPQALNESRTTAGHLDVPGAVAVTGGMIALVYGLSNASEHSWSSTSTIVSFVISALLLGVFALAERRSDEPMMPLEVFKNRNRSGSYAMMLLVGIAMFSMFYFLTQYMQNVWGWSPIRTGVGFLPMTVGIVLSAGAASRYLSHVNLRIPVFVGPALVTGGLFWLSHLSVSTHYTILIIPLFMIAIGMGTTFVPLTLSAVSGVKPHEAGLASALLNTCQQIGGAVGLALLSTIAISSTKRFASSYSHPAGLQLSAAHVATVHGYAAAFGVASIIALAAVVIGLVAVRQPDRTGEPTTTGAVHVG